MPTKKVSDKKEKVSAPKKSVKKSGGKEKLQLVRASGEYCFWMNDGSIVSNLCELAEAFGNMSATVYAHHVTKDRNDFADWIEGVLRDDELAKTIRSAKKPATAHTAVVRRLKLYNI